MAKNIRGENTMGTKMLFSLVLTTCLFGFNQLVFANEVDISQSISKNFSQIDFSKEPTDEEKTMLKEYYKLDAEKVFNDDFAKRLLNQDLKMVDFEVNKRRQVDAFVKEQRIDGFSELLRAGLRLGTCGDILVTYSFSSFGTDVAAVGHAAIVHNNSNYTVESFPDGGVAVYDNNWRDKSNVYGVRVKGASLNDYRNAASYALSQAKAKKPYNWNFFNKGTTDSFYCSQLVWRSWKNQGYEVDRMNLGDWEPVSPAELVGGSQTYVFYQN